MRPRELVAGPVLTRRSRALAVQYCSPRGAFSFARCAVLNSGALSRVVEISSAGVAEE